MTNIAIVGKMYAGKTTLAEAFVRNHGYQRMLMAGPLKNIAALAYGGEIRKDAMYDTTYGYKSGREILQEVGQAMKVVDRDFWLKAFFGIAANESKPIVVDDVRFRFEAEALKSEGWYIIKVNTPETVRMERARAALGRDLTQKELSHESEIEVDSIRFDQLWDGTTPLEYYDANVEVILDAARYAVI